MKSIFYLLIVALACAFTACSDDKEDGKTSDGMAKVKTVKIVDSSYPGEYQRLTFNYDGDKVTSMESFYHGTVGESEQIGDYARNVTVTYPETDKVIVKLAANTAMEANEAVFTYTLDNGKIVSATEKEESYEEKNYTFTYASNGMLEAVDRVTSTSTQTIYKLVYGMGSKNPESLTTYYSMPDALSFDTSVSNQVSIDLNYLVFYNEVEMPEIVQYGAFARLFPNFENVAVSIGRNLTVVPGKKGELVNKLTVNYDGSAGDESYTSTIEIGYY